MALGAAFYQPLRSVLQAFLPLEPADVLLLHFEEPLRQYSRKPQQLTWLLWVHLPCNLQSCANVLGHLERVSV